MKASMSKLSFNRYDLYITLIIGTLAFGKIGGAFQVIRLISIFLFPYNILRFVIGRKRVLFPLAIWFAICFFTYGLISLSWSVDYYYAKIELFYIFLSMNIIHSLICFAKKSKYPLESLLRGWTLFMLLTLPIAMWEFITSKHLYTLERLATQVESGRSINGAVETFAGVTFGNPNEYNTIIAFIFPYLFLKVLLCENNKQYLFSIVLLLLTVIIPIINSSRGTILSICVDFVVFFYFYYLKYGKKNKTLIYVTLLAALSIVFLCGDVLFDQLIKRSDKVNVLEDEGRIFLILKGLDWLVESNGIGIGPMGYKALTLGGPHNLIIELLVEYGIFIFLFACFVLGSILCKLYKRSKKSYVVYLPISVFCTLPFCSVINSDYLEYPSFWIIFGSLYIVYIDFLKKGNVKKIYK